MNLRTIGLAPLKVRSSSSVGHSGAETLTLSAKSRPSACGPDRHSTSNLACDRVVDEADCGRD
jgi:hypothetical protein